MTATQLRLAVQAVVQAHHTHKTFYSIWSDAKDRETELTYPCAVWDSWRTWIEEDGAGALNRSVAVRLLIVTAVATDRTPGDRDAAVEAADQAAEDYILKLRELYPDMAITNVATTTQFDEYTQLETGVILSFTATGGPLCLDGSSFGPVCAAGVVVNSNGTFTLSVPSGGTATLPDVTHTDSDGTPVVLPGMVPMVCTPGGAECLPGTVNLKNSEDTGLDTINVPCGAIVEAVAPDGVVTVKNSQGTEAGTLDVPSGGAKEALIGDYAIDLRDTDGTLISQPSFAYGVLGQVTAPDAAAQLLDSAGAKIGAPYPILSGDTRDIPVADSTITLPTGQTKQVKATQPYTVPLTAPLKFGLAAYHEQSMEWTVTADEAGSYDTYSQDGSSGTITYSKNGAAFASPSGTITLAVNDKVRIKRTTFSAAGWVKWGRLVTP